MQKCIETMEDMLVTLKKGDYIMAGQNHNSHGAQLSFPDHPKFPGMPKNADDRRFMAMPAYLGGKTQMAGMKWYGSNVENKKKGLPRSILMMMLNDKDTGAPLAMMSAAFLPADSPAHLLPSSPDLPVSFCRPHPEIFLSASVLWLPRSVGCLRSPGRYLLSEIFPPASFLFHLSLLRGHFQRYEPHCSK